MSRIEPGEYDGKVIEVVVTEDDFVRVVVEIINGPQMGLRFLANIPTDSEETYVGEGTGDYGDDDV